MSNEFNVDVVREDLDWDTLLMRRMETWLRMKNGFDHPVEIREFNRHFKSDYSFYNIHSRLDFVIKHKRKKELMMKVMGWRK